MQFRDGAFHHAGEVLQRAANGDLGFNRFEFALETLNFAEAFRNDLGVLFVELFQVLGLRFIIVEIRLERGEFFGIMSAVGFVIVGGRGLEQAL